MYKTLLELISLVSAILLLVLMNLASPTSLGPVGLLSVFLLIYLVVLGLITDFIYYGQRFLIYVISRFRQSNSKSINFKQAYYYSGFISMAPVILIALSSIGSIGFYEIFLTILFVCLGCFFVAKR